MEVGAVGVAAQIKLADHDSLYESDTCSWKQRRSRRVAAAPHPAHLSAGGRPWRRGGEPQGLPAHLPAAAKKKKVATKASLSLCFEAHLRSLDVSDPEVTHHIACALMKCDSIRCSTMINRR